MAGANPVSVFLRAPSTGPALRVGLLVSPAARGSALASSILKDLKAAAYVQLVGVAEATVPRAAAGWLFGQYLQRIDARYTAEPDPLAAVELVPLLADVPAHRGAAAPDLWIVMPQAGDDGQLWTPDAPDAARHGVWYLALGDSRRYLDDSGAFAELLDGNAVSAAELRCRHADGDLEVLGRVECSTTPFPSMRLNRVAPLWSARHLVLQKLWELHTLGAARPPPLGDESMPPRAAPGGLRLGAWMLGRGMRQLRARALRPTLDDVHWKVAVRRASKPLHQNCDTTELRRFRWLESPRGTFWADPFLFEHGATWLFFEEMDYALGRAHIACGRLTDDGSLLDVRPVLKLPYHLSYPQVFSDAGEIYMLPEASAGGSVTLYRARQFPWEWVPDTELLDFPCVDSTVFRAHDKWWMFTSPMTIPGHAPCTWLFAARTLRGPWSYHAASPVSSSAETARMAGNVLSRDGVLVRPSQDCGLDYGRALLFNEVQSLEELPYRERTIGRVGGGWLPGLSGVHTYNRAGEWETIDGKFKVLGASVRT